MSWPAIARSPCCISSFRNARGGGITLPTGANLVLKGADFIRFCPQGDNSDEDRRILAAIASRLWTNYSPEDI